MPEQRRGSDEAGFSLPEMIVTLLVVAIFMAMAATITIHVLGQTAAQRNTLTGVQQAQQAERTFGQYLRSAQATSLSVSSAGNDVVFATNVGTSGSSVSSQENCNGPTGTAPPSTVIVSCVEGIEAELCPIPKVSGVDALDIVFGLPVSASQSTVTSGSGSTSVVTTWTVSPLHECIAGSQAASPVCPIGSSGSACGPSGSLTPVSSLPASYSSVRIVQTFDVLPPSASIFDFYTLTTSTSGSQTVPQLSSPLTTASVDASPTSVQAVGLTATFEPAPGPHRLGYSAEEGTTIQTVAFLRNQESENE